MIVLNEEAFDLANLRYHNDPEFHARVTMAEQATVRRLEIAGFTLSRSYHVAIRMGAVMGLFASEVPVTAASPAPERRGTVGDGALGDDRTTS